jgi:hypothetical protein
MRAAALRASTFLRRLFARARFAYIRLLEFGDDDYAWSRFLDYVNDRRFEVIGRFIGFFSAQALSPWGA